MRMILPLIAVIVLMLIAFVGVDVIGMQWVFGVIVPYAAFILFVGGVVYRIVKWAKSPVPFRIPTTCGQQKSLHWIKANELESPVTGFGVLCRMALEILCFRSLFRNTQLELREGPKLSYAESKWLWAASLAFHWTFFIILIRHLRFLTEPVPFFIGIIEGFDGFLQATAPTLYITDMVIVGAVTFLFIRRVLIPQLRYISLPADYFPLFLLLGMLLSGILMRYIFKVDVVSVKALTMGLVTLHPIIPQGIGFIFYIHLFMVSVLLVYFPFSKLMHLGGIFLTPTRNLANTNRMKRHINPWNYPVKVHSYEEYEEDFREKMIEAGIPVEKD